MKTSKNQKHISKIKPKKSKMAMYLASLEQDQYKYLINKLAKKCEGLA